MENGDFSIKNIENYPRFEICVIFFTNLIDCYRQSFPPAGEKDPKGQGSICGICLYK